MSTSRKGYRLAAKSLRGRQGSARGGRDRRDDGLDRSPGSLAARVDEYLDRLQSLNYSADTVDNRRVSLRFFCRWAQDRDLTRPERITRSILEAYRRHLFQQRKKNGKPLAARTQRLRLNALKHYFSHLSRQRLLEANPASELQLPRPEQRLPPEPLSHAEVAALLGLPDVADPLGLRDRAMLELFYATGIRRTELCRLAVTDLQREKGILFIRQGKGRRDRVVPVGPCALHWLESYLDRARPRLLVDPVETGLFLTVYGGPFNPDVLSRLVTSLIKQADVDRGGSCHLLRHTCATHMLEGGADVRYVQELLGHAKLDTTAIYTRVSIVALQEVHARCHPACRRAD